MSRAGVPEPIRSAACRPACQGTAGAAGHRLPECRAASEITLALAIYNLPAPDRRCLGIEEVSIEKLDKKTTSTSVSWPAITARLWVVAAC